MLPYFKKLSPGWLNLRGFEWEQRKGEMAIELGKDPVYLRYYRIKDYPEFWTRFRFRGPKPASIYLCETTGTGHQGIHQDINTGTTLNYYIDCAGDPTRFYRYTGQLPEEPTEHNIDPELIQQVAEFIAQPKDSYLLNVQEWHDVVKTSILPRKFIQWNWTEQFDLVRLNLLNN
jgi:hypothetical protein